MLWSRNSDSDYCVVKDSPPLGLVKRGFYFCLLTLVIIRLCVLFEEFLLTKLMMLYTYTIGFGPVAGNTAVFYLDGKGHIIGLHCGRGLKFTDFKAKFWSNRSQDWLIISFWQTRCTK